jgi:hypothetical protein
MIDLNNLVQEDMTYNGFIIFLKSVDEVNNTSFNEVRKTYGGYISDLLNNIGVECNGTYYDIATKMIAYDDIDLLYNIFLLKVAL